MMMEEARERNQNRRFGRALRRVGGVFSNWCCSSLGMIARRPAWLWPVRRFRASSIERSIALKNGLIRSVTLVFLLMMLVLLSA